VLKQEAQPKHPWLAVLEASPQQAVADLMAGYAAVFPYTRADAPDVARMLVGHLPADDPARKAMATGLFSWLEEKRFDPLPADPARLQDFVRQVSEAFEIISLVGLVEPALKLREQYVRWFEWAERLNLAPSRDARASYLRMLANTQLIVADHIAAPDALAPFWMRLCRSAGSTYPKRYLQIGLLGLRRMPSAIERGDSPWMAGLAVWALAQKPTDHAFLRAWRPMKRLYPASPKKMRQRVFNVLSQKMFADAEIQPPGWWANDPDFPKTKDPKGHGHPLQPPPLEFPNGLIRDLRNHAAFSDMRVRLEQMVVRYVRYTDVTGDDYFLVRSFCKVGKELLRNVVDAYSERAQFAEDLARRVLRYQPRNPIAWGLWRDALFSRGAFDASIALGWETVRRFPNDPLMRTELAEILIARNQLDEALSVIKGAIDAGISNHYTYQILARLLARRGEIMAAKKAIEDGLSIAADNSWLLTARSLLDAGKPLLLVANARQRAVEAIDGSLQNSTALALEHSAKLRRLRPRLQEDDSAMEELKEILKSDPNLAYAQILAARHRIWHASEQPLPPVAAAFEEALAAEDLETLKALTAQMPRLESLVLLARAILGDIDAANEVAERLRDASDGADDQAAEILRERFQTVFQLIDGGLDAAAAIAKCADKLRIAIYDTNEALSAPELMAA
jgi:hypothetical protein